jgi:hypothetical protein
MTPWETFRSKMGMPQAQVQAQVPAHAPVVPPDGYHEATLNFRPFRRYMMGTGILCHAGAALGNTFRGHEDFQMTDNIIAKTHIGHYTMWHKAVVVDDRRLYLAEDMFCSGYVGGECHKARHIQEILEDDNGQPFQEDPIGWMRGASVIQIPVRIQGRGETLPRSIDLTKFVELQRDEIFKAPDVGLRGQLSEDDYFDHIQKLFVAVNSEYDRAAEGEYMTAGVAINTLCFRTMEVELMPQHAGPIISNKLRTLNQGHFGVNGCYEGARRPRSGFIEAFKDCEYEKQIMKTFG